MKVSAQKFKMDSGLNLVKAFEDLGIKSTDIERFPTPVVVTSFPHYSVSCLIGYYPTISSQLASIILMGYDSFVDYVEAYNSGCNEVNSLLDILNSFTPDNTSTISSISSIIKVLNDNRSEFKSFVSSLKKHRPVGLLEKVDSVLDVLESGLDKYYVAYIANNSPDVPTHSIYMLGTNSTSLAGFDVSNVKEFMPQDEYDAMLKDYVDKVEEYDLSLVFSMISRRCKFKNQSTAYSTIYDLLNLILEKWGAN